MNNHFDGVDGPADRAVSNVIGVMLIIAITVIIAAIMATFMLDMGHSMWDDEPVPFTGMDANVFDGFEYENSEGEIFIIITFETGDRLDMDEVDVLIRDPDGVTVSRFSSDGGWTDDVDGTSAELTLELDSKRPAENAFSAGDTILIKVENDDGLRDAINQGEVYTIAIVHHPSASTAAETTVRIPIPDDE